MKLAKRMDRLGTEMAFEVLAKARRLEAEGMDIVHLELGEPDFDTPANVIEAGARAMSEGHTHYGPSPGYPVLRQRIAEEVSATRSISVTGDNVVVTPGAKPIMFFVILALVDHGDEVLYPNPGFPIYESMIHYAGGIPVPMRLYESNDFNVDVDEVSRQVTPNTRLMIVNSPNNPCGGVIDEGRARALADVAAENDVTVLSDEVYRRFLYEGEHHSIASFPGMRDRTIILDGFSKTYAMTGWRIGYGVMPVELVEPISRLVVNSVSCTAGFTQMAALDAFNVPSETTEGMISEFKRRRDMIVDGLNGISGIRCPRPQGAFYVFPNVEGTGMTSVEFADRLLEEGGVARLSGDGFGKFGVGYIRISFTNSAENIQKALERIESFVAKTT